MRWSVEERTQHALAQGPISQKPLASNKLKNTFKIRQNLHIHTHTHAVMCYSFNVLALHSQAIMSTFWRCAYTHGVRKINKEHLINNILAMPTQIIQYSNWNDLSPGMNSRKCFVLFSYAVKGFFSHLGLIARTTVEKTTIKK